MALGQAVLGLGGEGGDEGLAVGMGAADGRLRRMKPVRTPWTQGRAWMNACPVWRVVFDYVKSLTVSRFHGILELPSS
jgi:hypothetical protein